LNEKTLILVRHAHRDKDQGAGFDNGLSEKGQDQARKIGAHFATRLEGSNPVFLTSPKKRCVETIQAIYKAVLKDTKNVKAPKVEELLGEGPYIDDRVEKFFDWWKDEASDLVVACSHGDWIPTFVHFTVGIDIPLKKAAYVQLNLVGSRPMLTWLVQRV